MPLRRHFAAMIRAADDYATDAAAIFRIHTIFSLRYAALFCRHMTPLMYFRRFFDAATSFFEPPAPLRRFR